jgi:15-cis-phytoene synthase
MLMDCDLHRYQTYEQLDTYMYGSAAVIGLMMCEVMGDPDPRAIPYAHVLGDAMQMTNFLRDIREDFVELDRIYLPQQDLARYQLSHRDIEDFCNFSKKNVKTYKVNFCNF